MSKDFLNLNNNRFFKSNIKNKYNVLVGYIIKIENELK